MPRPLQQLLDRVRDGLGARRAVENARRSLMTEQRMLADVDALGLRLAALESAASRQAA